MTELRYNPLLDDWTMVATHRQNRPDMPKDYCPFCPGSGKVPNTYDVYKYDNDFPALSSAPPEPSETASGPYRVLEAYGKCEVILYSPEHMTTLPQLPVSHIRKLIDLWTERYVELAKDPKHKYVFIFENRGPEVGVTMLHPHGQIYAYPYIPQKIRVELDSCKRYYEEHSTCLICDINQEEARFKQRMLLETEYFTSYIPFFTDYPFGAFISCKAHNTNLAQFTDAERNDLAKILKLVTAGMDALYDREFPYMMVLHQSPVNGPDVESYYHFHIEFYPPLRGRSKIKYLASSESGAWAPCNPTAVEDTAAKLREAIIKVQGDMHLE